jgi:hypothetical protein
MQHILIQEMGSNKVWSIEMTEIKNVLDLRLSIVSKQNHV